MLEGTSVQLHVSLLALIYVPNLPYFAIIVPKIGLPIVKCTSQVQAQCYKTQNHFLIQLH